MLDRLPCLDSAALAAAQQQELAIPRAVATHLGQSALEAAHSASI